MKKNNEIYLIGGAPTVGKSTIAKKLSKKFGLPWISTDQMREFMTGIVRKKDYPYLFHDQKYTAEKYLKTFTPKQIVKNQNNESIDVWKGVKVFIKEDWLWESFIIEGIAILPKFVYQTFGKNKNIRPIFLIDEDADKIKKVVYTRGLWDDAHKYSDDVKEVEIKWALLFSHWLKKEALKYNYPVIEMSKNKNDFKKICNTLRLT